MKVVHQLLSGDVAGGQLVALRLARGARDSGHEPLLVTPTEGPLLAHAAKEGIEVRVVPLGRSFRLDAAVGYARVLRALQAEILHTHTHLAGGVLGRVAGRLAGVPVLAHMHIENAFRSGRVGRTFQVALDDATARLCARIVAVSEATRLALEQQGYPRAKLEVVRNGVELDRAEPVRLAPSPAIVHVGRLAPVKGQLELIRAVARVDGASLVLVGRDLERGGAYERELRAEADRLGIAPRVVFAGGRDDVPGVLAGADVFALPSHAEGLPLVVLEAMAQARPVVATPVGGTGEAVDGETGVLVPPGDVDALAAALARLLADPKRARGLGEAGRRRAEERFSAERMTARILEIYSELVRTMAA